MNACKATTQPQARHACADCSAQRIDSYPSGSSDAGGALRVMVRVEPLEGPQAQELADRQLAVIVRLLQRAAAEVAGGVRETPTAAAEAPSKTD